MTTNVNTPARRALSVASMGADIAGGYLGYMLQRAFLGKAHGERKLKSTHTRAAQKMRDEMTAGDPAGARQFRGQLLPQAISTGAREAAAV